MTKTEELLKGVREYIDDKGSINRELIDPLVIERNLGIVPDEESSQKVLDKLEKFGHLGIEGFAQAIATFAIMRGEKEHEELPVFIDGSIELFKRPFTFVKPTDETNQSDLGLHSGYTYGLNIIGREMSDIRTYDFQANESLRIIIDNVKTEQSLIAHRVNTYNQMADSDMEFGYFGCYPVNAASVAGYLVLPRPEAIKVVQEAAFQDLV